MRRARATTLSTSTPPRRGGRKAASRHGSMGTSTPTNGVENRTAPVGADYISARGLPRFPRLHAKSMVHRIVGAAICRPRVDRRSTPTECTPLRRTRRCRWRLRFRQGHRKTQAPSRAGINPAPTPLRWYSAHPMKTQAASAAWVFSVYSSFGGSSVRVGINCRATFPLPRCLT